MWFFRFRKIKREIPVTYQLDWWSHQKQLQVNYFKVDLIHEKLSIFSTRSIYAYSVAGQIKYKAGEKPFIKAVHISERMLATGSSDQAEAEIQITPIVEVRQDDSSAGGALDFSFTNEHGVKSMHWGVNKIRFACSRFEEVITLVQSK